MSDPGYAKLVSTVMRISGGWTRPDGSRWDVYDQDTFYDVSFKDKSSVRSPGWPSIKRDNPYYVVQWSKSVTPAVWVGESPSGDKGTGTTGLLNQFSWPARFGQNVFDCESEARDKALMRLIDNLKNQNVNAAVALAEGGQTSRLVASTARRLAQTVISLKKGNIVGAIRGITGERPSSRAVKRVSVAGAIPRQWLEIQYGWKPLLSDVYGAVKQLSSRMASQPDFIYAKSSATMRRNASLTQMLGDIEVTSRQTGCAAVVNCGVRYRVGSSFAHQASQLGVSNPLSVAWELVPWSFVVDWFIPIGNYLNSLDYAAGLEFAGGWISRHASDGGSTSISNGKTGSGGWKVDWSGASNTWHGDRFEREVLIGFPTPPLPSFKNPLSLTHVANGLSLLATAFGRR